MKLDYAVTFSILYAQHAVASNWLGTKAVYNKWHETELERWLSDHNIPYPTPADRKDLENSVKDNWNSFVVQPYNGWKTPDLQTYLVKKGKEIQKGTEQNKDSLVQQVKASWTETEDSVASAYANVRDWIFDSWTDSQLKSFCDKNGIPVPQPRTRDSLLKTVRESYASAANKLGEHASYPGNWLYESWSESDLKAWLDERGFPAPQPSSRDRLVAEVRRNSRLASLQMQEAFSSASANAAKATNYLSDELLDSWSDSKIKDWADKNGIKVPQGSKRNELIALARKHRAMLAKSADSASASASSYYGAATTSAGNLYAQATNDAYVKGQQMHGAFGYYFDFVKEKLGFASGPSVTYNSIMKAASKSASSASSAASSAASVANKKLKQEL